MAALEGSSTHPISIDSDDDSMSSSYMGSDSVGSPQNHGVPGIDVCGWRTARFHEDECSRYFDCPSHQIERALSDVEDGGEGRVLANQEEEDIQMDSPGPRNIPEAQGRNREVIDLTSPSPPRNPRLSPPTPSGITIPMTPPGNLSRELPAAPPPPPPPPHSPVRAMPAARTAIRPPQSPETALPRWQPDAEATYCPICRTQFSFFNRKHHCRKCGRVVCANCSPHFITIPRQYIVQPPNNVPSRRSQVYTASVLQSSVLGGPEPPANLGGGESVRLCNPCVPDPNTTPPQAQPAQGQAAHRTHLRIPSGAGFGGYPGVYPGDPRRYGAYYPAASPNDPLARSRSVTMGGQMFGAPPSGPGAAPGLPNMGYRRPPPPVPAQSHPLPAPQYPVPSYYSAGAAAQYPVPAQQYRGGLADRLPRPQSMLVQTPTSSSLPPHLQEPPRPARPQLAEEDECPVCHNALPDRNQPNFETLREEHIVQCLASNASSTGLTSRFNERRTRMFPYTATKKDCVDQAECVICLEEFEIDDEMARLECLCRFHRKCIEDWFKGHPGQCPVHQHDSLGLG